MENFKDQTFHKSEDEKQKEDRWKIIGKNENASRFWEKEGKKVVRKHVRAS
jgi:hypothetical protein